MWTILLIPTGVEVKAGESFKVKSEDDKILHLSQVIIVLYAPYFAVELFSTCFIKIICDNEFWVLLFSRQHWGSQRRRKEMNLFLFFWKLINKSLFWEHFCQQIFLSYLLIWFLIKSLSSLTIGKMGVSSSWVTSLFFLMNILIIFHFLILYFVCQLSTCEFHSYQCFQNVRAYIMIWTSTKCSLRCSTCIGLFLAVQCGVWVLMSS